MTEKELFKICNNSGHLLNAPLPEMYHPGHVTRYAVNADSQAFSPIRCRTVLYQSFILDPTKLWNEPPSKIAESVELQEFKVGENKFLVGLKADI